MENPRPAKVAVVEEVRQRFADSQAALLTEYRGISVDEMAQLRRSLRAAGGDYKIYKNTLVRFAVRDLGIEIEDLLIGPTAIAFVPPDSAGDAVTVAKALRDFAKANPNLVVKGGILGDKLLSVDETKALAEVAPRDELLARLAGGMAAPMQQFAGLLAALPRNFAYGLSALIAKGGASGDGVPSGEPSGPTGQEAPVGAVEALTEQPDSSAVEAAAELDTETEDPAGETATETEPAAQAAPTGTEEG